MKQIFIHDFWAGLKSDLAIKKQIHKTRKKW